MEVRALNIRDHGANCVDRCVDERYVLREQCHSNHNLNVPLSNRSQPSKGFDAALPTSGEAAHCIVKLSWSIYTDRNHQTPDAAPKNALDQGNGSVAEPACGRKIQQVKRAVTFHDGRNHIFKVPTHEQLAASQLNPAELRPLAEERLDFGRC